jgi:hypothetical protein
MDGVVGRGADPGTVSLPVDLEALCHRAGVRRLFELPVEQARDCTVRIRAGEPGRCAVCSSRYPAGEWIGHSREADGWVGSCCS